jgi:D-sedoheptulose 7-phosphate isomerase
VSEDPSKSFTAGSAAARAALLELSRASERAARQVGPAVDEAASVLRRSLQGGGKLLVCGNGGSAADAQHFVAELIGRMGHERGPLPAISLSVDPSVVTALANDYGYEQIFARQIEALGKPGDAVLVISASGRSANILRAAETARRRGLGCVALLGEGAADELQGCDVRIHVPARDSQRVQELHTAILHVLCSLIENRSPIQAPNAIIPTGRKHVHDSKGQDRRPLGRRR